MTTLDDVAKDAARRHAANTEYFIKDQISLIFRQGMRVTVRKPRWMPERTYRWLMRTIVVEETPLCIERRD